MAEATDIIAQISTDLHQSVISLLELFVESVQRRVPLLQPGEGLRQSGNLLGDRTFGRVQFGMDPRGLTEKFLRVLEASTLFRERLLLSGLDVGLLELTHLEAEEVDPTREFAAVLLELFQLGLQLGKHPERLLYR